MCVCVCVLWGGSYLCHSFTALKKRGQVTFFANDTTVMPSSVGVMTHGTDEPRPVTDSVNMECFSLSPQLHSTLWRLSIVVHKLMHLFLCESPGNHAQVSHRRNPFPAVVVCRSTHRAHFDTLESSRGSVFMPANIMTWLWMPNSACAMASTDGNWPSSPRSVVSQVG